MTSWFCSVIVPSYNSSNTIRACLDSLLIQDYEGAYEIMLVDSSTDDTAHIVCSEYPTVQLISFAERADPAQARNTGAQRAQGDVLAFIDSDCSANPDWLARLVHALQSGFQAAGGAIANTNVDNLVAWAGYFCEFREFLPLGEPRETHNLTLGNAAYRRESFWAVGGFPNGCFPQEDQVFHAAFREKGGRIYFDPRILVSHTHREDVAEFLDHQRMIGRSNARVIQRLGLPGKTLAKRPWLARLALPALVSYRLARTLLACRKMGDGILFTQPALLYLCARGMLGWGKGFLEGAEDESKHYRLHPRQA